MTHEQLQNQALLTYQENLTYLKEKHFEVYEKVNLFDLALNENLISSKFELEYKGDYFDILDVEENSFYYGKNSIEYSQEIVNTLNFEAQNQVFKTFIDLKFTDDFIEETKNASINSSPEVGIAPIVHYVNKNLPKNEVLKDIYKFMIFGVGLGIHIPKTHDKIKAKLYLIIEPNLEIFRLSLFITNYAKLAQSTSLILAIADDENSFKAKFDLFYQEVFILNHYFKFLMFSNNCSFYTRIIQNFLVSQNHTMYSYNRYFQSLRRTIFYINQNLPVLNLSHKHKLDFMKKPILFLGAGPSLQNDIEFVKKNQNKFIIIAIYATMPILEKNDIKPDIITQYDEQDKVVMSTINKVQDINFFSDTIFILSSHIDEKLMNSFKKENIFIFQALFEIKKDYGILTSPSIGEITYALSLILGAKDIYMLGIDMALDAKTGSTHIEGHAGAGAFKLKSEDESDDKEYFFRKNIIKIKGNLLEEVNTTPVFKTLLDYFNDMTNKWYEDTNIFNLSQNGAYFNKTIPTNISDLNISDFKLINKKLLSIEISEDLKTISSIGLSKEDRDILNQKLEDAKKIKQIIENFYSIKKYPEIKKYKNNIIKLLKEILYTEYKCSDLQHIIHNFVSFSLHYIWYFLSLENTTNHKNHIKYLNSCFYDKLKAIVDEYIKLVSK
jgi:hypothetical protein